MDEFWKQLTSDFQLPLENPILVFCVVLAIILFSPLLLRRFNIPAIVGLIIAGVIVGPHTLNLLRASSAVQLFSTIGLLYIMFIVGLELDLGEFKIHRRKSITFGILTFLIPLSIGFPVCYFLLDYSFMASLLTASMFSTHTLVSYPIVSRLGVSGNPAVAVTIGGTFITDVAVMLLFAIMLGTVHEGTDDMFWTRLILMTAFMLVVIIGIVPRIAAWVFTRLENEKYTHYIFVLSTVFFAAFLAQRAGLEPMVGAFLAGLVLNKLIPKKSELADRIEFIGNSLFIPFFLMSVGMLVDLKVLLKGPGALLAAIILSAVALTGKGLAAWLTRVICKFSVVQGRLIFGLSASHAAVTIAIITVGYNKGVLSEDVLNGTVVLILVTCVVAAFVTERAAKQLVAEKKAVTVDVNAEEGVISLN
jgi:Kef-type K+ transport system membrane component KefB